MKLLQFPWARHDALLSHALMLASLVAAFFLTENFVKRKNNLFSVEVSSRVCDFLRKNFYKVESLYICGGSVAQRDFFHNDWRSVREGLARQGEKNDKKQGRGAWGSHEESQTGSQTDRQTDRHTDRLADRLSDRLSNRHTDFTVDTNNPALNEHILAKARLIFNKLDSNSNSAIDLNEFKRNVSILSKMRSISEKLLSYLFDLFDVNKDQRIDYVEFLSLNSYDFNYVKLIQILFDEENQVEGAAIGNYLEIYFSEFLGNVAEEVAEDAAGDAANDVANDVGEDADEYFFTRRDELVQSLVKNFLKNEKKKWDTNDDGKLQLEEFQDFQLCLLLQIDHLANFLQLDLNLDGRIDLPELLFYISHDGAAYRKLRAFLRGGGGSGSGSGSSGGSGSRSSGGSEREALFKYIREDLHVDSSLVLNLQFLFSSFDVNGDLLLDLEEYKDQMSTFTVLDAAPEIVFSS
ncbi:hypothetical protein PVMG_00256 [Plasmodium vivax Mauritania I]|uniref:EF-hand domain-containing protein n=1 Tax=Plasmodium vivax Mauritania I TaxID=1035515 RepID=A0A0J9T9S1_PLAVI|nr:hypothetical protein PVMG_00256 [Plasmodium vivax Mauritania I]